MLIIRDVKNFRMALMGGVDAIVSRGPESTGPAMGNIKHCVLSDRGIPGVQLSRKGRRPIAENRMSRCGPAWYCE